MKLSNLHSKKSILSLRTLVTLALSLFNVFLSTGVMAIENEASLNLSPTLCIAIHQGQQCYVDIKIGWKSTQHGQYCLFSSQQAKALKCWKQVTQGTYAQEIVAKSNVKFMLRHNGSDVVLRSKVLEVAWVYKKNTRARSSWRMF